jgi:hypothetical protein
MSHINDAVFDELLTAALYRASELDNEDMPSENELNKLIHPSIRFQRRMKTLLSNPQRYIRNMRRPVIFKAIRATAAVFISFLLLLGSAMTFSPTVRAAVYDFVRSWFVDRTEYRIPEQGLAHSFIFTYIPDGFELIAESEDDYGSMRIFQNSESKYITIAVTSGTTIVDNEHSDFWQTIINGHTADVYESNDPLYPSIIVIYNEIYANFIIITTDLSITELISIAEGKE